MSLFDYTIQQDIIPVSTVGHTIGKSWLNSKIESDRLSFITACPIHGNNPTVISKKSFISACLLFQERAAILHAKKTSTVCNDKFIPSNKGCLVCETGKKIKKGEPFDPPKYVTFKKFKEMRKMVKRKLSKDDVLRIRIMSNKGYSVRGIHQIFPFVSESTVRDVVNRRTWKTL